jgi:hypothetical protein
VRQDLRECGFPEELKILYSANNTIFAECPLLFGQVRFAAVLKDAFFWVSSGIGPSVTSLAYVEAIKRSPSGGLTAMILELCWSEPTAVLLVFFPASRGRRNIFGSEAVDYFLPRTRLALIIRFHQAVAFECALSLANQLLTVVSTCEGNKQSGVVLVAAIPTKRSYGLLTQIKRADVVFLTSRGFGPRLLVAEAHGVEDRRAEADPRAKNGAIIDKHPPVREEGTGWES